MHPTQQCGVSLVTPGPGREVLPHGMRTCLFDRSALRHGTDHLGGDEDEQFSLFLDD